MNEQTVVDQVRPLFKKSLEASDDRIYLANHSLGRPPDTVGDSLNEFYKTWQSKLDESWDGSHWMGEVSAYRRLIAALTDAPNPGNVIPKTSAGQGLRAILNASPNPMRVVSTTGEFDSIDFILRSYERSGRISLCTVEPTSHTTGIPLFQESDIIAAIDQETDLVVVSMVFFTTGQVLKGLPEIVRKAKDCGAKVVVDGYHAVGVLPVSFNDLGCDFMIGGCYKYLRGGPGACYLIVADEWLDTDTFRTLDTGWFAKLDPFSYHRPASLPRADGGDSWMESTPPIATFYQANPGLRFTASLDISGLRNFVQNRQSHLVEALSAAGLEPVVPADPDSFGAFVVVPHALADLLTTRLAKEKVTVDSRGGLVRFGPDLLTTKADIQETGRRCASILAGL